MKFDAEARSKPIACMYDSPNYSLRANIMLNYFWDIKYYELV